jgi:peroxiredoxin
VSDPLDEVLAEPKPGEHWRTLRLVLFLLLATAVIFTAVGAIRAPSLPDQAPEFALPTLTGETISLSQLRGQTTILNFWATWCAPCRAEIPAFSAFADAHPEVAVLGIATDGPRAKVAAAAKQLDIRYPVLLSDPETHRAYGISTIPTTVIVDAEGRVRYAHSGLLMGWQLKILVWWFG